MYEIQRAGSAMQAGMIWPEPRRSDSVPSVTNAAALDAALAAIQQAEYWRPNHFYAYRLAGQVYLARADWLNAAESFEQARQHAPHDPLIAWEASLAYEQMVQVLDTAPVQPEIEQFSAGQLAAPGELVRSVFCSDGGAATCYTGRTTYTQPYSTDPEQEPVTLDVLFLHPPASMRTKLTIPTNMPVLRFAVGLDPAVREWQSDGADFSVRVLSAEGDQTVVDLAVDAQAARHGWAYGFADLRRWAGQDVTVELVSAAGPNGDTTDDWYGWGDLALTSYDAARFFPQYPMQRMIELWRAAGQNHTLFLQNSQAASAAGNQPSAEAWARRAALLDQ